MAINYAKTWAKRHAESIPQLVQLLRILHAKLSCGTHKIYTYVIHGVVNNSSRSVPTLFMGDRISAHAFADSVYSEVKTILPIGMCTHLQAKHILPKEFPGMIVVCEQEDAPLTTELKREDYLMLPTVDFVLDLNMPAEYLVKKMSRRRRRDLRNLESQGYRCYISRKPEDFDYFYWKMYVPFVRDRFDKSATIRAYTELNATYRMNGGIVFVERDEKRVAGMLFRTAKGTVISCCVGVYEGDPRIVRDLACQAALFFLVKWAKNEGFLRLNYGACMPFIHGGLFTFKREWGMNPEAHEARTVHALRLGSVNEGTLAFLKQNPFILRDKGMLKAVLFSDNVPTESELLKIHSDDFCTNLDSIIVIAWHVSDALNLHRSETSQLWGDSQIALGKPLRSVCELLQKHGYDVEVSEIRGHGRPKLARIKLGSIPATLRLDT